MRLFLFMVFMALFGIASVTALFWICGFDFDHRGFVAALYVLIVISVVGSVLEAYAKAVKK